MLSDLFKAFTKQGFADFLENLRTFEGIKDEIESRLVDLLREHPRGFALSKNDLILITVPKRLDGVGRSWAYAIREFGPEEFRLDTKIFTMTRAKREKEYKQAVERFITSHELYMKRHKDEQRRHDENEFERLGRKLGKLP